MKDLANIESFGNIEATMDKLLEECFEEHQAFKEIIGFEKFLVIGKKGSGKTAIFRKLLKSESYNIFCEGACLTDYPWYHHEVQAKTGVPDHEKFIQSWKYLILIVISRVLINKDNSIPNCESKLAVEKFLKDTYGSVKGDITNIFTPNKKLKFKSLLAFKVGGTEITFDMPFEQIEMRDLPKVVQDVNKVLLHHVIECLNPNNSYYICFDELDYSFNKQDKNYINSIVGLIRAAKDFNLQAKEAGKKINICVFLRDDIYDLLDFEDKRKITQNFVSRIEWDTERATSTLKELMKKRFTAVLRETDEEVINWESVFDESETINGKMLKYDYLKELTCLRPRDMIDLCNQILEKYKSRKSSDSSGKNMFINMDITDSKGNYSNNLFEEFKDEIHKHIPNYKDHIEVLKKVGKSKFLFEEFIESYKELENKLADELECKTVLEDLFTFSLIGNYKVGGTGGGSKRLFRYKDVKENFRSDLPIVVHDGLVNCLGLKAK